MSFVRVRVRKFVGGSVVAAQFWPPKMLTGPP